MGPTIPNSQIRPQSIKGTARLLKQTPAQVRKALARREIKTVRWAGRDWIPPSEDLQAPQGVAHGDKSHAEAA